MTGHVAILPSDVLDAISTTLQPKPRFLRLPHPRTGIPSLFLPSRREGRVSILEVHAVIPPNTRSWFLDDDQIIEDGKLLILTPIDPVFLLIPILQAAYPEDETSQIFRPADDIFEQAITTLSKQNQNSESKDPSTAVSSSDILTFAMLDCIPPAMKHLCQVKEITPEIIVYRFSIFNLVEYLQNKVLRLAKSTIFEQSRTVVRSLAKEGLMEDGKESLLQSGRIKAACDLVAQHLPPNVKTMLLTTYDFTDLDVYLKSLQDDMATLKVKVADTNKIKKQPSQPSKEEQKKRKAKESSGIAKLKKVNVEGMSKLSSFFKPK